MIKKRIAITLLLMTIILVLLIGINYNNYSKIIRYDDFYGDNGSFIPNNKDSIFPKKISENSKVVKFCAKKFSFIDDSYLGYLVIDYNNDEYYKEKNRLISIDSSVGYEGYYGMQSFEKELCAIDIGEFGLVYALSNDDLKEISYIHISFCNNYCDINYRTIIKKDDLPIGFDASFFNQTRINSLKGNSVELDIDKESNLMFYKIDIDNNELKICNCKKAGYIASSFSKINEIYKKNGTFIETISFEKIESNYSPQSLANLFNNPYLKEINGFENLDTSNVKNFSNTFSNCNCIDSNIISSINTFSGKKFNGMFYNNDKIDHFDLSIFDTFEANSLTHMFEECDSLTDVKFAKCNLKKVVNITDIFKNCNNLETVDFSDAILSNCRIMDGAFSHCTSLRELNFDGASFLNVVSMDGIFESCESVECIDLSNFDLSNLENRNEFYKKIDTNNYGFFKGYFTNCKNLKYVYFPRSFDLKCIDYEKDFVGCDSLKAIFYKDGDNIELIMSFAD